MPEFTTLQEMLLIAHDKLESGVWDFINGGTESETTLRRNRHGLDRLLAVAVSGRHRHGIDPTGAARRTTS